MFEINPLNQKKALDDLKLEKVTISDENAFQGLEKEIEGTKHVRQEGEVAFTGLTMHTHHLSTCISLFTMPERCTDRGLLGCEKSRASAFVPGEYFCTEIDKQAAHAEEGLR